MSTTLNSPLLIWALKWIAKDAVKFLKKRRFPMTDSNAARLLYSFYGWVFIRPIRLFFWKVASASFGPRWLPRKNKMYPHYGSMFDWPNFHWWALYKTVGKFCLWLYWDGWRPFCDWTGGYRRTYPWIARFIKAIGETTAGQAFYGGRCYHCNSTDGNPLDLSEDETGKYFTLTASGSEGTPDGTNHWFQGITTCPKCGYKQEYSDGSL
jgi:hypothetical protein